MIGHLQRIHEKYKDKGVVLIGINTTDPKSTAIAFLRSHGVTFVNAADTSSEARAVIRKDYRCAGVPLEYIIGADGKVVLGWYGDGDTGEKVLGKLGIK